MLLDAIVAIQNAGCTEDTWLLVSFGVVASAAAVGRLSWGIAPNWL